MTAGARVRINAQLASSVSLAWDTVTLPEGISYQTTLASLRVDASFFARMFLNVFTQYNNVTGQLSSNVRFDFIHHPLSDVYVVVNDTRVVEPFQTATAPSSRAVIVKLTHLFSF